MKDKEQPVFRPDCIQLGVSAQSWQDTVRQACRPLIQNRFVTESYPEDIIQREQQWPTGLPTYPVAVAIPHALTGDNIIESQVAACVLDRPVPFGQSGGVPGEADVDVRLVFILAIKDPQLQLGLLRSLMAAFSDEDLLNGLVNAASPEEFADIFNRTAQS